MCFGLDFGFGWGSAANLPPFVAVVCNMNRAQFDVKHMSILIDGSRTVTPTEYERLSGKGASKKWKVRS